MDQIEHGVLQVLPRSGVPVLFLVYINDLPKAIEHKAISVLFDVDTRILITSPNNIQFQNDLNIDFGQLYKLFKAKLFYFNFDKAHLIQFIYTRTCTSDIQIVYEDKPIPIAFERKFLGLFTNSTLSWKTHNEYLKPKQRRACYARRPIKQYISINTPKTVEE